MKIYTDKYGNVFNGACPNPFHLDGDSYSPISDEKFIELGGIIEDDGEVLTPEQREFRDSECCVQFRALVNEVKQKIEDADIIYICGGDTVKLLEHVKEYNLEELLLEAYNKGTVIAGMSAGAILLSNKGFSDSLIARGESDKYEFIKGLNFININFCPHYNTDPKKKKDLEEYLSKNNEEVYSLENLHYKDLKS